MRVALSNDREKIQWTHTGISTILLHVVHAKSFFVFQSEETVWWNITINVYSNLEGNVLNRKLSITFLAEKMRKDRKRKIPKFRILLFLIFSVRVSAVAHKTRNQKFIRAEASDRKKCPKVTITVCNWQVKKFVSSDFFAFKFGRYFGDWFAYRDIPDEEKKTPQMERNKIKISDSLNWDVLNYRVH